MATPLVPVISAKLIVNAATIAGQPPQLTFSAQIVSQIDTFNLGPLTAKQFTAVAVAVQVPGQLSIERLNFTDHLIVKQA